MAKKAKFTAMKSYGSQVKIKAELDACWNGVYAKITSTADISVSDARVLATSLIDLADAADKKAAKEQAANERRAKWREREIAAGRMVVWGGK